MKENIESREPIISWLPLYTIFLFMTVVNNNMFKTIKRVERVEN